jgi:hypothetical protein
VTLYNKAAIGISKYSRNSFLQNLYFSKKVGLKGKISLSSIESHPERLLSRRYKTVF